jgi:hypothetical protein
MTVRVGQSADDIYAMTGWDDCEGSHPGDEVPRLLNVGGVWQLWYLAINRDGEQVVTNQVIGPVSEDTAVAVAERFLELCGEATE